MVNYARCKVAGANVTRGKNQAPFGGKVEYDYMMWVDSDIAFKSSDFFGLLSMNKNIASGWYAQPSGASSGEYYTPVVEKMEDDFFERHGTYQFLTTEDLKTKKDPIKVDYVGFGWVLVKRGVFESIPYPWFAPKLINLNKEVRDVCSEDVAFCLDAKEAGYDIWLNPQIRVGHEKTLII